MSSDPATSGGSDPNGASGAPAPPQPAPPKDAGLGRELGGDLPCVVCGYNLRGLSIRSMCPECGTNLRATILSLVDPQASELRPITFPRLTAAGVVMWAFGAVAVAMMAWLPQAAEVMRELGIHVGRPSAGLGVMLGLVTSAIGSIALIRPHSGIERAHSFMALLATLAYVPLGWMLWRYHTAVESLGGQHYLTGWSPTSETAYTLAMASGLIAAIIMLQRPNARLLVARSMVMRTGRVDRQTLYAMALAAAFMGVGSLLGRVDVGSNASTVREVARSIGVVLIAFGGVMVTIGAIGSLLDCARIAGAILIPKMTIRQVIRKGRPQARSKLMSMIDPNPPPPTTTSSMGGVGRSSNISAQPPSPPAAGPAGDGARP
jgi:hypothetical protein